MTTAGETYSPCFGCWNRECAFCWYNRYKYQHPRPHEITVIKIPGNLADGAIERKLDRVIELLEKQSKGESNG